MMRQLFLSIFVALLLASALTAWFQPEVQSDVPVLYWVTDANPARKDQVKAFHGWLEENGLPRFELRLDTANRDVSKMIIQGVSGVGGDVLDIGPGGLPYFHAVGLLEDVTESARRLGFDPSHTFPAIEPDITLQGRQYLFPCNVFVHLYWVNKATFAKYGQPAPPASFDFETFERVGRAFVAAANQRDQRERVFFASDVDPNVMRRSLGLSTFNETLTRCVLNDERNVEVLNLIYKWTHHDRLLPSAADREAFSVDPGYGGLSLQLFARGNYGMVRMGRYALIQFRQFGEFDLAVSDPPYREFPNAFTATRAAAVYRGGRHKELARLFLAFLASEKYNRLIVHDADGLPPNPVYTEIEDFRHPPEHPNEWGLHERFAEAARSIAIAGDYSPFVLPVTVLRIDREAMEAFMAGRITAEVAAETTASTINREIERTLNEQPALLPRYQELLERQRLIDEYRAQGRRIPMEWIENPFHRRYYQFKGWIQD